MRIKTVARETGGGISRRFRDRRDNRETNVTLSYRGDARRSIHTHTGVPGDRRSTTDRGGGRRARTKLMFKPFDAARPYTGRGVSRLILSSPAPSRSPVRYHPPPPDVATTEPRRERGWLMSPLVRQPASRLLHRTFYMGCPFGFCDAGFRNIYFVNRFL